MSNPRPSGRPSNPRRPRSGARGEPQFRLRAGFVVIAIVLSIFGVRLLQLQGIDAEKYASRAALEGTTNVVLPAERGEILDRNGVPLADSVAGMMVVANPQLTGDRAPELARLLADALNVDYFKTLKALRSKNTGSKFEYIARRVPSTLATDVLAQVRSETIEVEGKDTAKFAGIDVRPDPVRDYPAKDVAANLVGFIGTDEALGGFERTFEKQLAGTDGKASYQNGAGYRIPLGKSTQVKAVDGQDLHTTIDRNLQWFVQRVLGKAVDQARADSGVVIVQDTRSGEILSAADYPTYDASDPLAFPDKKDDLGSRALNDAYEPGSVQKVLTVASLIDAGKVTPRTPIRVPSVLRRQDRPIGDWWEHDTLRLTMTGVLAKSSNIGTVLAGDKLSPPELAEYLRGFGLGERTDVGVRGESRGIVPAGAALTSQTKDRITFGQSISVNAMQMTAALNTLANGGTYVSPSLVRGHAVMDDGTEVGTDTTTTREVVSPKAARQTARMMERVLDSEVGVAPSAQVPGYRVSGKTGTAQRVDPDGSGYQGTSVSFGGFAPSDDPRFTVYVVLHNPKNGGGGGSTAGPVFSRVMGYALSRYKVPPTDTPPSRLPVEW